jgi:hypothetical protein
VSGEIHDRLRASVCVCVCGGGGEVWGYFSHFKF